MLKIYSITVFCQHSACELCMTLKMTIGYFQDHPTDLYSGDALFSLKKEINF